MSVARVGVVSKLNRLAEVVRAKVASSKLLDTASVAVEEVPKDNLKTAGVDVLLIDPDDLADVLGDVPRECRWVQSIWAGVDLVTKKASQTGFSPSWTLTRYAGPFGPLMTEYMLAQVLARERHVVRYANNQVAKQWKNSDPDSHAYRSLADITVCVLGVGEIGRVVASTFVSLGASVHGVVRKVPEALRIPNVEYFTPDHMAEAMRGCDYILNLMPSTPATRGMISEDLLARAQCPKATLINAGRGDVTANDNDWCTYIDKGLLEHAILDVFREEPLPSTSPLWEHPGISITPHIAATTFPDGVAGAFVANLERFAQDPESVRPQVSFKDAY